VDQAYVANRLRYRWHALKVTPAGVSDLSDDVGDLPNLLFQEVADCASDLLRTTCADGREKGLQKSLNPFRTLRNKLEGLSFVDPLAAALAEGIDAVLNDIPGEGTLGAQAMDKLRGLARRLSSPSSARAFAKGIRHGDAGQGTTQETDTRQAEDCIVSLPQSQAQPQVQPRTPSLSLPAPVDAPQASSPGEASLTDKRGENGSSDAAPAASVDAPTAVPADAPAVPLTNNDLEVLFREESRRLAPAFTVPEDLLRKAMGL
jgi:hypothetical protein